MTLQNGNALPTTYKKRYQFALEQTMGANTVAVNNADWLEQIKKDYQVKRTFDVHKENLSQTGVHEKYNFQPPSDNIMK